jgi:hypothetical protein
MQASKRTNKMNFNINTTFLILAFVTLLQIATAFTPSSSSSVWKTVTVVTRTRSEQKQQQTRLWLPRTVTTEMNIPTLRPDITHLAFAKRDNDRENVNVNVNEIGNIDAVTLTAVGFALIAFNFLVFANMGDAGIGGIVARIINTFQ